MNLVVFYQQFADGLGEETGASDALIHVHAGMLVLLLARVVTGKSLGTPVPLAIVALAGLANEVLDYLYQGKVILPDAIWDMTNTLFWPIILMIGIKIRGRPVEPGSERG